MDLKYLRDHHLIILECISGSNAYGLNMPGSDTDIRGVFILPKEAYYGLSYFPQIHDESNNVVFYELRRFMELLLVNNPNILELLNTPQDCVLYKHRVFDKLVPEMILSKLCKDTFGRFALSQIKKSKGLNKKIVNPMGEKRKNILSFCYVSFNQGAVPLFEFLNTCHWNQEDCGLINIPHMGNLYGLYHHPDKGYNGIMRHENSNEISLSSIPKGEQQEAFLYFNKDGYSKYCSDHHGYWDWVMKRNEDRYANTIQHGKNYDAKNMMHVFRLLNMAAEIGRDKVVNVRREDREFLLQIRGGHFEYDHLLEMANQKQAEIEQIFATSDLAEKPDADLINNLLFHMRQELYLEFESMK